MKTIFMMLFISVNAKAFTCYTTLTNLEKNESEVFQVDNGKILNFEKKTMLKSDSFKDLSCYFKIGQMDLDKNKQMFKTLTIECEGNSANGVHAYNGFNKPLILAFKYKDKPYSTYTRCIEYDNGTDQAPLY